MRLAHAGLILVALCGCPDPDPGRPARPDVDAGFGVLLGACGVPAGELAEPWAVLDTGHGSGITCLQKSGQSVASVDRSGRWVLWRHDGLRLAAGQTQALASNARCATLSLRGETLAVLEESTPHIRVHSATTGAALSTLPARAVWGLSADGTWLWVGSSTTLEVFSRDGTSLFVREGDYSSATGFGHEGALFFARGSTLERLSVPGGTLTAPGSFSGTFTSWFVDGSHFMSKVGTTLFVNPIDGGAPVVRGGIGVSDSWQGLGDWLWRYVGGSVPFELFKLDAGASPVESFPPPVADVIAAGDSIALLSHGEPPIRVIHLTPSGATVTTHSVNVPSLTAFASTAQGEWVVGAENGSVWNSRSDGGAPLPLGCGAPKSLTGADTGLAAIATGSGAILLVDLRPDGGHHLRPAIDFYSSQVELSADGQRLAAAGSLVDAQYWDDRSLRLYDPADGGLNHRWAYAWSDYPVLLTDFSFARGGARLSHLLSDFTTGSWIHSSRLTDAAGNTLASPTTNGPMRLSPDGLHGFVTPPRGSTFNHLTTTELFSEGVLTGAVQGLAIGWLSNDRVLVNVYERSAPSSATFRVAEIRDTTGALVGATALPELGQVSAVSGTTIYDSVTNATYDLTSGLKLWASSHPRPEGAALAGDFAVSRRGSVIYAEPR